jgi:hypothetical protein
MDVDVAVAPSSEQRVYKVVLKQAVLAAAVAPRPPRKPPPAELDAGSLDAAFEELGHVRPEEGR